MTSPLLRVNSLSIPQPCRCVQIYKSAASGAPTKLLSRVAAETSPQDLEQMTQAQPVLTLRLIDIAPGANINHYLRSWAGEYTLHWTYADAAVLTFSSAAMLKSCSNCLAAGIRNVFRVDRSKPAETSSGTDTTFHRLQTLQPVSRSSAAAQRKSASSTGEWQVVKPKAKSGQPEEAEASEAADRYVPLPCHRLNWMLASWHVQPLASPVCQAHGRCTN